MFDWGPPDSLLRQALARARARSLAELNFFTRNAEKECSEGEAKVGERAPSLPQPPTTAAWQQLLGGGSGGRMARTAANIEITSLPPSSARSLARSVTHLAMPPLRRAVDGTVRYK